MNFKYPEKNLITGWRRPAEIFCFIGSYLYLFLVAFLVLNDKFQLGGFVIVGSAICIISFILTTWRIKDGKRLF